MAAALNDSTLVSESDKDSYSTYKHILSKWGYKINNSQIGANALNALFLRIGKRCQSHAMRLDKRVADISKQIDSLGASDSEKVEKLKAVMEDDRKSANEHYLKALQFYFMATQKAYFGNDKILGIQLPELDASLYLAYRGALIVGKDIPALTKGTAAYGKKGVQWISSLFKKNPGEKMSFGFNTVKGSSAKTISLADIWLKIKSPGKLLASTGKALVRGLTGRAKTPLGRLMSVGGLGLFVYLNYAKYVELPHNRIIIISDDTIAKAAENNFWRLIEIKGIQSGREK